MKGHEMPDDLDKQTDLLVEAGVADQVVRFLPSQRASAEGVRLAECKFWARWTMEDDEGRPTPKPRLQVAVRYPSNRRDTGNVRLFHGCAITVFDDGPNTLTGDETLDDEQLKLVRHLAGPRPS